MNSHIAPADATRLLDLIAAASLSLDVLADPSISPSTRADADRIGRHALANAAQLIERLAGLRECDAVGRRAG